MATEEEKPRTKGEGPSEGTRRLALAAGVVGAAPAVLWILAEARWGKPWGEWGASEVGFLVGLLGAGFLGPFGIVPRCWRNL